MNIDWDALWEKAKFILTFLRGSFARVLSLTLCGGGIAILTPPLWLDLIINSVLSNPIVHSEVRESLSKVEYIFAGILIFSGIVVFLLDFWFKHRSISQDKEIKLLDEVKDHPKQTADLIAVKIRSQGFTAPHLQDEKIDKLAHEITLLRFFVLFPKEEKATALAESVIDGELSGGTPQAKARALALVARYLCVGGKLEQAKSWLLSSKKLCQTEEAVTAQAFFDAIEAKDPLAASSLLKVSSPSNYTAFFVIKITLEGNQAAIDWLDGAGLSVHDLDNDGKVVLLSALLTENQWARALDVVLHLDDKALSISPALAYLSALTFLVNAIKAIELREGVLNSIPFNADRFPLADDFDSIGLRNRSVELFKLCSRLAKNLSAEDIANMSDKYVLWLELRNSQTYEQAIAELKSYFVSYNQKTLEYLPLAYAFGIDIDYECIEQEVNRQTALNPANHAILGLARFILAQKQKSMSAAVDYISLHRKQMEKCVNSIAISMLEIEALAKLGLVDDAQRRLDMAADSGASDVDVNNLQNIIDTAKGADPVALAISQYQQSEETSDLAYLVNLLERNNRGDRYYLYCQELFERTGQESDAIRVCNAASSLGKFSELDQFLLDRMNLVKISEGLQAHWAWSLFRKGDLSGAQQQIALLSKSKFPNLKALEINLAIFSGNWDYLSVFVEDSWNSREELKVDDLLHAAQLAKAVLPGRARQIVEYCTSKHTDDPEILAASYLTATTMGWEDNQETSEWLHKAMDLSNGDGPLRRASLDDLIVMMSEAREKNQRVYKAYFDGDTPIFTVAQLLNKTMSDFYLIQPLENKKSKDIRRKNLVPIFHGVSSAQIITCNTIAIDSSGSLVLENIGLLTHLFDCFERIVIPHSFMRWLFEEKQKVAFHQPSQIEKAKYFERLVSDGVISVFHPKTINNPGLALDVGDELAYMLEEAHANSANELQALVVCSYPVYKVGGSFREVEADLSSFHHSLISCTQLIKKLESMAVITETQCIKALKYLHKQEQEWPSNIQVATGARLYLDHLSITYLMTVEMLEKLSDAGFELYVFKGERDRYRSLINYDAIIEQVDSKIENIRKLFSKGLTSGQVLLAEMALHQERVAVSEDTTKELFETLKVSDAALIDDRFFNKHREITIDERTVRIFTTLDFIETLHHKELISQVQKLDARTSLREFGFEFVNISSEELKYHLSNSVIVNDEFKPTKQLKLIRENLLLIRISGLVQLPRDAHWLLETMKTIRQAIKEQWLVDIPLELSRARSNWLYELLSYREWAQSHQIRDDGGMAYFGECLKVNSILIVPDSISQERKEDYKAWVDECVLAPLRENDPLSFKNVVDSSKAEVKSISERSLLEEKLNG